MTIKWGVVGASGIAHRRTMSALNEAQNNELYALMVRDMDRAKKLAQEHGAPVYYDSVDAILSDPDIDAAYIATPVYLHCDHVIQAAEKGKHVLCEKPMAMNVKECQSMIDACRDKDVQLHICFLMRYHPHYQRIRQIIAHGEIGQVIDARSSLMKWYSIDQGGWRRDPARAGGGVLMDLGSHIIDLLSYILGEASQVTAFTDSRINGWKVEETGTVMIKMKGGAHATAFSSFVTPQGGTIMEIYGSKGSLAVSGGKLNITIGDKKREEQSSAGNLYKPLFEHFHKCLQGEAEPISPGTAGLENIRIITSAYESVRTNSTISC
ncbi:hypothetical protein GF312_11685 [Candidatus Poribacteria bacterium]|nr:hypothetical protein [Candidatus Poribacteria bacterium]